MYTVQTGDFILSGIDARNGAFGIVPEEMDGAVVTNDFWYFKVDADVIDKRLFLELTQTSWFDEICRKGSDGTTQRIRLQKDKFYNQEIQLPPKVNHDTLLNKIISVKTCSKKLNTEITHQQSLLKKLRQSILQDAISGKLTEMWRKENPCLPAPESGKYWVYVIKCSDDSNYIGQTCDLIERYRQHLDGAGSEWTKKQRHEYVMYWECFSTRAKALEREEWLKTGFGRKWIKREEIAGRFWHAGEPATELLERIKAEKERLVKEKKIKKTKPFPLIAEDEIPFDLPEGWIWCRLGQLPIGVEYGTSSKTSNVGNVCVFAMGHIQDGKLNHGNFKYITDSNKDLPRLYLKHNDLLFNRTNSWELVEKTAVYKGVDNKYSFASYLIRLQFIYCNVDFYNYVLNSQYFKESQIEPQLIKQCGQANFNGTKLQNSIVPLPPQEEFNVIVSKVEKLLNYCDELEQQIGKSQEDSELLMQAILQEVFGN